MAIFVDFTKVIDHINHSLLIQKLLRYGYHGKAAHLIKSYLQYHVQTVDINNALSSQLTVPCGVPQGSILGPLLFILYINDININSAAKYIIYAHDTSIFLIGNVVDELIDEANSALHKLDKWACRKYFWVEYKQNKSIISRNKNKNAVANKTITLNFSPIAIEPSFKTLGVVFQETFSWYTDIYYLAAKLSQVIGSVYRNCYILPLIVGMLIFNSLFQSRLNSSSSSKHFI